MKKIVEFLIDDSVETGVKTISLVDSPAMESDFIAFSKEKKSKYIQLETEGEYKQIVAGLSMIPDKLIYRIDPDSGSNYYGYFSQDTIEQIRTKYHKEMQTSNVNLDHDDKQYVEAYLVESYLLNTEARVEEVKAQGIEEAVLGSWYTQFKIEDEEVFQKVLDGEYNGFSIEAYLNKELTASLKNKFKEKEKKMKTNLIDKFKAFLVTLEEEESEVVTDETTLESALVPELDVTVNWGEVDAEVTKTYKNEDDEEVTEAIGQGEFVIEDGRTIVVGDDSNLIEVKPAEVVEDEPVVEEEEVKTEVKAEEVVAEVKTEVKAADEPVVEPTTEPVVEEEGMPAEVTAWLKKIAGDFEDGDIYLSFYKEDGALTYGSVSTWSNIKLSAEKLAKITELETKLSEPAAEPKLTDSIITSGEAKELTVYETVMKRKGLA